MILYDSTEDPIKVWEQWAKHNDPVVKAKRWLKFKFLKVARSIGFRGNA